MASIRDVIYEAWFFRLSGSLIAKEKNGKKVYKPKGSWKERYFILVKQGDKLYLETYDKKPNEHTHPKDRLSLFPSYRLSKLKADRYVCQVGTPTEEINVGATDVSSIDTFAFNLQTQTVLRDSLEGSSFTVLPENTLEQERLGAVGSVCMLHVSPWGVSLALQQSRSLIAHWPLKCIRSYESDSKGQFTLDTGKKAPFGEGTYVFQTRKEQDDQLYNLLDNYVLQAASLSENHPSEQNTLEEDISSEYDHLKRLTIVHPRPRESVRASVAAGLYDRISQEYGGLPGERDSVVSPIPDILSDSAHADINCNRKKEEEPSHFTFQSPPRESTKSDLIKFNEYPNLVSPTERRQVMIKPRTLIDKSVVVSQELPQPLIYNPYEDPDQGRKKEKPLKLSPPPVPPLSRVPPVPARVDKNRNTMNPYEDPDELTNDFVEYMDPDMPKVRPPPPPMEKPVTALESGRSAKYNTYVDESDINPYVDPDVPSTPPPPVPRMRAPPVPPFPQNLAMEGSVNEYTDMDEVGGVNEYFDMDAVVSPPKDSMSVEKRNSTSRYEDPYADAQDLEVIRSLSIGNSRDEYLGPDECHVQLRRSPAPAAEVVDYGGDQYLQMSDIRKSAPTGMPMGKLDFAKPAKSRSMFEIDRNPQIFDIDIDGPAVPEVWVTPAKKGDVNRNTMDAKHFGTWSPKQRYMYEDEDAGDDDAGYLLLPPKVSRSRLKSQSCEELSDRQRQNEPDEEGYFEIDDSGVKDNDIPMPFTGLVDMKHLKKQPGSPRGSKDNVSGGQSGLKVPPLSRFQRSISNPDMARKGHKSHGKHESEDSPAKRQSKLTAFLYGTLHKKKSKTKLNTSASDSEGNSPRGKPMKALPPQETKVKHEKSPKEKHKHKSVGHSKDIIGGIEITHKGKSFVKAKRITDPGPFQAQSYTDSRGSPSPSVVRSPSPHSGRRLPSLPADIDERELPRSLGPKHARSQPNLI